MSTAYALLAVRLTEAREDLTPMSVGYDRVRFTAAVKIGDTITVNYDVFDAVPDFVLSYAFKLEIGLLLSPCWQRN